MRPTRSSFALRRRDFLTLASSAALLTAGCASAAPPSGRSRIARTSTGALQGVREHGVNAFKGVRYAQPPLGDLRFQPPQALKRARGVVDAVSFGRPAVQMYSRVDGEPRSPLGRTLTEVFPTGHETRAGDEDCLFLNVWTPGLHDGRRRPVMVWVHGGGMVYGSGAWPAFHGYNLAARHDVVVVTINHRLNAFGYLDLEPSMGAAFADSANAGHLDLVAALQWVRENAEAFGGDPGNVTLFGQSGGGAKISALMATPSAKGLFHKVIIQSGPGLRARTKEAAAATTDLVLAELGVAKGEIDKLRALPAETIRQALYRAEDKARVGFGATVDGRTLLRHPFDPDAPEQSKSIPMLIGTNKDEAALFQASQPWFNKLTDEELTKRASEFGAKGPALLAALRQDNAGDSPTFQLIGMMSTQQFWAAALTQAERKVKQGGAPVYMYRMDWGTPIGGGVYRAGHSVETPLMFDTVEANRALLGPGPDPQAVATQMSDAWAAFARTGNPNTPAIPAWPAYDLAARATMIFNVTSHVEHDPYAHVRAVLQG